ncbi:hypothetical protein TNCV_4932291 [Trichonephila clavipes]|nr:hypothetical protein TNCV_4932291 [Trichonephila clavipes]
MWRLGYLTTKLDTGVASLRLFRCVRFSVQHHNGLIHAKRHRGERTRPFGIRYRHKGPTSIVRAETPFEIHRQSSKTCDEGVMNVINVHSCVQKFKKKAEIQVRISRTSLDESLIARGERHIREDHRLNVRDIASKLGISIGSVA